MRKLPVLYLVEDNGYAISVPVEVQTPGGDISRVVEGFLGLRVFRCDGTDYLASYRTMREAVTHARERNGPVLVHATVIRPYSHSLSDDERLYKTPGEREAEARRDPLRRMQQFLKTEGLATDEELADMLASVDREVNQAADEALRAPKPDPATAATSSSRPTSIPSSADFATEPQPQGKPDTMVAAINATLKDEMARNPRIVVFGQDVADASNDEALPLVAGKGGVFKVTHGLQRLYGEHARLQLAARRSQHRRARGRHGAARAEAGRRDSVLRLHLAGVHADSRRAVDDALPLGQPLVVPGGDPRADRRLPARRRAVSQPVRRLDLRAHAGHPHRLPVERAGCRRPAAHGDSLRRPGALLRAQAPVPADLQQGGVSRTGLHDPVRQGRRRRATASTSSSSPGARSCSGRCWRRSRPSVRASASRSSICGRSFPTTGRRSRPTRRRPAASIIAHEDQLTCGFGAEIAARISEELFEYLDAPVKRVASLDCPVAYAPELEEAILPGSADVLKAIKSLAAY